MADDGAEQNVRKVLENSKLFTMYGENFEIIQCSKPTVLGGGGEVKTDIYIKSKRIKDKKVVEIKISYKKPSFSFVENKIKKERAEKIYGKHWSQIIRKQIIEIKENFTEKPLIYFNKKGRVEKGSITLGWRYEMEHSGSRLLSTQIKQDIASQIWKNKNADERYIHGIIDGISIPFSGVPNFCLTKSPDEIITVQDIFNNLIAMDELIKTHGNITSAFLAQNYRSHKHKQEGNRRHLAVWIKWKIINKKLGCEYVFDNPLNMESGKVFDNLSECLLELGFDLSGEFNIDSIKHILDESIRVYSQ
jgi:hypothetical protein